MFNDATAHSGTCSPTLRRNPKLSLNHGTAVRTAMRESRLQQRGDPARAMADRISETISWPSLQPSRRRGALPAAHAPLGTCSSRYANRTGVEFGQRLGKADAVMVDGLPCAGEERGADQEMMHGSKRRTALIGHKRLQQRRGIFAPPRQTHLVDPDLVFRGRHVPTFPFTHRHLSICGIRLHAQRLSEPNRRGDGAPLRRRRYARPLRGNAPGEDRQSRCRTSAGKRIRIRRRIARTQIPGLPARYRHPHHHGVRR